MATRKLDDLIEEFRAKHGAPTHVVIVSNSLPGVTVGHPIAELEEGRSLFSAARLLSVAANLIPPQMADDDFPSDRVDRAIAMARLLIEKCEVHHG